MTDSHSHRKVRTLLYSSNSDVRAAVQMAIGRRASRDLPEMQWVECATHWAAQKAVDAGDIDLIVLDGESQPVGGMGLARQFKNEIFDCAPIVLLTGRPEDAWLAAWSLADAAVPQPLDPLELTKAVAELVRRQVAASEAGAKS